MSIRVALIGNMNNNHFSMMRYLRDLGLDAHLLMYNNEAPHFHPKCDTWEWDKWSAYVHLLPFSNGGLDLFLLRRETLRDELQGFNFFIGNGIAPVFFRKMGQTLDMFIPYGDGVEFIVEHHFRWQNPRSSAFSLLRKHYMEIALKSSVNAIISVNVHAHSRSTFERLGLKPISMPIPMLYLEPRRNGGSCLQPHVRDLISRMRSSSIVVLSHVSHIWKNLPVPHFMGGVGKRNDWLVRGFAEYVKVAPNTEALLCLFEYGCDVGETKSLIKEMKIQDQVIWFPKMSRREIMTLLPYADIGGSEFAGMYWGGCGWEFLASGVPMLHQLLNPEQYESHEMPLPPFFNVQSATEIRQVLLQNDRQSLKIMGDTCRKWFDQYQGYQLAKRYVQLIESKRSLCGCK